MFIIIINLFYLAVSDHLEIDANTVLIINIHFISFHFTLFRFNQG